MICGLYWNDVIATEIHMYLLLTLINCKRIKCKLVKASMLTFSARQNIHGCQGHVNGRAVIAVPWFSAFSCITLKQCPRYMKFFTSYWICIKWSCYLSTRYSFFPTILTNWILILFKLQSTCWKGLVSQPSFLLGMANET